MRETIKLEVEGIVRAYQLPHEVWQRLNTQDRERMKVAEQENLITLGGYGIINGFLGAASSVTGFATYLALGNGALNAPNASDTSLVNETKRLSPASSSITGNVTTLTYSLTSLISNVVFTEAGLISGGSSTLGSGLLSTHLLFPFTQAAWYGYTITYTLIRY